MWTHVFERFFLVICKTLQHSFAMFPKCVPVILKYFCKMSAKKMEETKLHLKNSTILTAHRWPCLKHLPTDIWFYLQDSGAARFVISDMHTTDFSYAKAKSRSIAEVEGCYFIQQEGYVKTHWRSSKLVQKLPKVDIVGSMLICCFSSSQSRFCTASKHTLQTGLRFVAWSPSVAVSTIWNKWVSRRTLWMEMRNDSERRGMNFDLPYLSIVKLLFNYET